MVHALKLVHGLLQPAGVILSVHDLNEPSPVAVRDDLQTVRVGELDDNSDYALQRYADDALNTVVAAGLFAREGRKIFAYETHMDTQATFNDWLAGTWESTIFPATDQRRLEDATAAAQGELMIITNRRARMTRLAKVT